jgi:hypothetical protein
MTCFELVPKSLPDGSFAASWFDDEAFLWDDDRLRKPLPIGDAWIAPSLLLARGEATPVLFNPNAIALSEGVKAELASFPELDFLPVSVRGHGAFFVLHVTAALDLPPGSNARLAPSPSGNLVQLHAFPPTFLAPFSFFRVRHPTSSAAGRAGYASKSVYLSEAGADCIRRVCGGLLEARPM